MITCKCGKTIDKVPDWLQGVQVEFVCNNCPNKRHKPSGPEGSPDLPNMSIGAGAGKIKDEDEQDDTDSSEDED